MFPLRPYEGGYIALSSPITAPKGALLLLNDIMADNYLEKRFAQYEARKAAGTKPRRRAADNPPAVQIDTVHRIILASHSPRRRELLRGLGLHFDVRVIPDIDESYPPTLPPADVPLHIAHAKARAYLPTLAKDELLITADTVVLLGGDILGKPSDPTEAHLMLRRLSGRRHTVVTGVVLTPGDPDFSSSRAFAVASEVDFAPLSEAEITTYIDRCRPFDKAGAYGIQEWIGFVGVRGITGSFYNVMGLPVGRLYEELRDMHELR